jgi:hypothetical protein
MNVKIKIRVTVTALRKTRMLRNLVPQKNPALWRMSKRGVAYLKKLTEVAGCRAALSIGIGGRPRGSSTIFRRSADISMLTTLGFTYPNLYAYSKGAAKDRGTGALD